MNTNVLIVTTLEDAEHRARTLTEQLGVRVEIASCRKAALHALRRREFAIVILEENLAEADPAWTDQIWQMSGLATPLQLNLALSTPARLARELKSALNRRDREQTLARKAVAFELEDALKSAVTGLLLESELALRDPALPPSLQPRLRRLVDLAGLLRERLHASAHAPQRATRPVRPLSPETTTRIA